MTNWNDIFDLYVGKDKEAKEWMRNPFINYDNNIWCTDASAALIVAPYVCGLIANKEIHKTDIPVVRDMDEWLFINYYDLRRAVDMCGKEEPSGSYLNGVRIGNGVYSTIQMTRVLKTMQKLNINTLIVVSEPLEEDAVLFQMKGLRGVSILQMPMIPKEESKVVELIKIG